MNRSSASRAAASEKSQATRMGAAQSITLPSCRRGRRTSPSSSGARPPHLRHEACAARLAGGASGAGHLHLCCSHLPHTAITQACTAAPLQCRHFHSGPKAARPTCQQGCWRPPAAWRGAAAACPAGPALRRRGRRASVCQSGLCVAGAEALLSWPAVGSPLDCSHGSVRAGQAGQGSSLPMANSLRYCKGCYKEVPREAPPPLHSPHHLPMSSFTAAGSRSR